MSDWIDCTALEAHQAWVAKAHDVEKKTNTNSALQGMWQHTNGVFIEDNMWQYRIREKVKLITIEIPCPAEGKISMRGVDIGLTFATQAQCDAAFKAITAAREGK